MKLPLIRNLIVVICLLSGYMTVNSQATSSGTLAGTDTVCYGNNDGYLNLSMYLYDIQYWESSISETGPWSTINESTNSLYYSDLTQTTYFRVILMQGAVYDTSNMQTIYVSPISEGGTLSGGAEVCAGSNSTTLSLDEYTGDIDHWEYSTDNGITWNNIAVATSSHTITNIATTTSYRVIVQSSPCESDTSTIEEIIVYPQTNAGTLAGDTAICYGTNSGELDLTGFSGDIVQWETSASGYSPWSTIDMNNDTLTYTNIVSTSYYRVKVKSGVCESQYSNSVLVEVSSLSEGGILSGVASVCSEANNGTLVLSGHNGDVVNWQYSHDYGSTWNDTANINHTLNYSGLLENTTYRAVVQSGVCPADSSEIATITVYPLPDVDFINDSTCLGQQSLLTNQSSISQGSIISFNWDFGNGESSNAENPSYTFPLNGIYTIQLTATSNEGCIDSASSIVKIFSSPIVNFSTQNACFNDSVEFTNSSYSPTGDNLLYEWNFGDGSGTATDNSPKYLYGTEGTYSVKLLAESEVTGCKDSLSAEAITYPRSVPDFITENICFGEISELYNNSTVSSGILSYYWTFGDGSFSIDINPSHTYTDAGEYQILLQVTTDHNCIDTISKTIYIHPVPVAQFNFDNICYSDTVHFTDETSIESGDFSWDWNFGNGDTSTEQSPDYFYSAPGTYLVNLQIESDSGCVHQVYENIEVYSLPYVNFSAPNPCESDSLNFSNLTTIQSGELFYSWDFDTGSSSDEFSPSVLYASPGDYDVQLVAWSGLACADSITKTITVHPDPVAEFTAENVCDGIPTEFVNESTVESGTIQSYTWDFGDGTNSIQPEPTNQYLNPGTYTVSLNISTMNGCTDNVSHDITVDHLPLANFNIYNVCHNSPINPNNTSSIEAGTLTYFWSFGDGDTSIVPEPNHIYPAAGLYPITLRSYSENGCVDSLIRYVEIYSLPDISASNDTSISKGETIMLSASGGTIYSWFPSTGLSSPVQSNPLANPTETTNYIIQVEDNNGCISTDSVLITVLDDFKITPSNVITPDGNGYNDTWKIDNITNYEQAELFIYDKWGTEVYYSKGYNNDWEGKNQNGDILPDGAYYYIIRFPDSEIIYKGSITILRNK